VIIDEYFASVERGLRRRRSRLRCTVDPVECIASDEYNGLLRCRATFWDESFLDIYETVSTELGYPTEEMAA